MLLPVDGTLASHLKVWQSGLALEPTQQKWKFRKNTWFCFIQINPKGVCVSTCMYASEHVSHFENELFLTLDRVL